MNDLLKSSLDDLIETGSIIAIKAELEAEGTRVDELYQLALLVARSETSLAVKIGGCEAISDLRIAREVRADYVVAPMVESEYALSKFISAIKKIYTSDEINRTNFAFNLETNLSLGSFDKIAALAKGSLNGVVFGRTDYTGSLGMETTNVESPRITNDVILAATIAKKYNLEFVVGGSISKNSVSNLVQIKNAGLDRFETRKVVFDAECLYREDIFDLINLALIFELNWLRYKKQTSTAIGLEDQERIYKIEKTLIE